MNTIPDTPCMLAEADLVMNGYTSINHVKLDTAGLDVIYGCRKIKLNDYEIAVRQVFGGQI